MIKMLLAPLKFTLRHWKIAVPLVAVSAVGVPLLCDLHIANVAEGRCHTEIDEVEASPVALLLGAARTVHGRPNAFYTARIEAAAELFKSGKVSGIIASGDNGREGYDEPSDMKEDLIAAGVPAEFITRDYAGFRTLDSVVRAKEIFGQEKIVIVSQRFHAERALYIADQQGIDACAYIAADPVSSYSNKRVRAREVLARSLAVADCVVGRRPKFLGQIEVVTLRAD